MKSERFLRIRDLSIILLVSLASRITISASRIVYGINFWPTNGLFALWDDYSYYYLNWLSRLGAGLIPYKDFFYQYPPLFIYTLYPFYKWMGFYGPMVPIVASGALTSVVISLITSRLTGRRIGIAAGIAYALSPFALLYESFLWLSVQPMLLLLLLAVYLLMRGNALPSAIVFSIAVLFRQEAILFLPVYFAWVVKEHRLAGIRALAAAGLVITAVSVPFLWLSTLAYLGAISYGLVGATGLSQAPSSIIQEVSGTTIAYATTCMNGSTLTSGTSVLCNPAHSSLYVQVLDYFAVFLRLVFPALILPYLFILRRTKPFQLLCLSYSCAVLILTFSFFHPTLRYYFLPSYALLLASSTSYLRLYIPTAGTLLSFMTPGGNFQIALAFATILVTILVIDLDGKSPKLPYEQHNIANKIRRTA